MGRITIGITETESRYENYPLWIKGEDPEIGVIKLTPSTSGELENCDGLVLTGGIDIHPGFYGSNRLDYPGAPKAFNKDRDDFEIKIFSAAQKKQLPVLAICRGMQLLNVALGGDLLQDLKESGKEDHSRDGDKDRIHTINVLKGSLLNQITRQIAGSVNSAHHQSIGKTAPELLISAQAEDGVAEGAEWKNKAGKSFLLCVQWHPERLALIDPNNPFASEIRKHYLASVNNHHHENH